MVVFGAPVCKVQTSKHYIKSLPLVTKDKRSCFSQGERSAVQLPLASYPGYVGGGKSGLVSTVLSMREKPHDFMGYCIPWFTNR